MKKASSISVFLLSSCFVPDNVSKQHYAQIWESKDALENLQTIDITPPEKDLSPLTVAEEKTPPVKKQEKSQQKPEDKDPTQEENKTQGPTAESSGEKEKASNAPPKIAQTNPEGNKNLDHSNFQEKIVQEKPQKNSKFVNDSTTPPKVDTTQNTSVNKNKKVDVSSLKFVFSDFKTTKNVDFKIKLISSVGIPKDFWDQIICGVEFAKGKDRIESLTNYGAKGARVNLNGSSIFDIKKRFSHDKTFSCKYSLKSGKEEVAIKIFFYDKDDPDKKTYVKNEKDGSDALNLV